MNIDDAKTIAKKYIVEKISAPENDVYVIVDAGIKEDAEGWYFPYQTARFVETKDMNFSVVGNWPVFVSKDGKLAELRRPPLAKH